MSFHVTVSSARVFQSLDDLNQAIYNAMLQAQEMAQGRYMLYLSEDPKVPRKTGNMASQAERHVIESIPVHGININMFFDTFYAQYVEEKVGFIENIYQDVVDILKDCIMQAMSANGIEVSIT